MNMLKKVICVVFVLFVSGVFPLAAEEFNQMASQTTGQEEKISVFDFKETPIVDVSKVFTDLTGKNVVVSKDIMKLKITLFLKEVTPQDALKTMCKLYNLWFSEEDNVIRIMTVEEYGKELTVRRDEKTVVYNLKYASCLAVADLLDNLFGDRIEYVEPDEVKSYGHIGTEEKTSSSRKRRGQSGYGALMTRYNSTYGRRGIEIDLGIEKELTSQKIEELEKKAEERELEAIDILEARRKQAIVYLAVFPRNNSIVCRSVDLRILRDIGDFIKEMDAPTSQVLLEGKILEITLADDDESFFDFAITPGAGKHGIFSVPGYTSLDSATFVYDFIDRQIETRLELFEESNRVKIIGTPMLLCANNAPGEFFIGEERPITVNYEHEIREFQERTTELIRAVIELRDIGTKLTVTPSINEDRTITMRFLAEVDTVNVGGASTSIVTEEGKVVSLPIDTVNASRVENIIIAKDASTLAIGGLIRESSREYERKVPLLGDIPILGLLFKRKGVTKEKTETVFLITPHIMMAPGEAQGVSDRVLSEVSDHPYIKEKQKRLLQYDEEEKELKMIESPRREKEDKSNPGGLLKGEVLVVEKKYNFAIINLGEDDGLKAGDILPVYFKGKFVGDIKVVEFRQGMTVVDTTKAPGVKEGYKIITERN
ncbi:MAG: type II secretion system protein GspD [Candidatus Omnitrophica bacterium]|nr:type II secretion system protein GspD [Candidatus Omnitrophota bacterium]